MRRIVLTILVLAIITTGTATSAQPNHTLEWGVDVDEEFTYALQRKLLDPTFEVIVALVAPYIQFMDEGQKATIKFSDLEEVPDQIDSLFDIPNSRATIIRENDSSAFVSNSTLFAVPIGDWDLLSDAMGIEEISGAMLVNNENEWGFTTSGTFVADGNTISVYQELFYEKENGTQTRFRLRYSVFGGDLVDVVFVRWSEGMPTILPPELQMSTLLIIGVGVAIIIMVAVIVYIGIKSKKPLVQQLGE
ncbi:MAG: hypothetical protein ACW99V_07970 [Candidatus Thorarchaeota archaeon]